MNVRETRQANKAQLAKIGGGLIGGNDNLWATILRSKYLHHDHIFDHQPKPTASSTWKGIIWSLNKVKGGFSWSIGNGQDISLWFDVWLGHDPLCLVVDDIDPQELCWTVSEYS